MGHRWTCRAAVRPWQEEKTFLLLERVKRKAAWPGRPTSASLEGVENKTLFLQVLESSARLGHWLVLPQLWGGVAIRAVPGPIEERGPG